MTELLTEGALLVAERYQAQGDRETLRRRAAEARARLRRGLYAGDPVTDAVDERIYPTEAPG